MLPTMKKYLANRCVGMAWLSLMLCQGCTNSLAPIAGDCSFMNDPTMIIDDVIDTPSDERTEMFYGTDGDDKIIVRPSGVGHVARMWLDTLKGDDTVCVENSPSVFRISVVGGSGDDVLYARDGFGLYSGDDGNDVFYTHTYRGTGRAVGYPYYRGGEGNDVFMSRAYESDPVDCDNVGAYGEGGDDIFFGRDMPEGEDSSGDGIGCFDGGTGDDIIHAQKDRKSTFKGGPGNDRIYGNPADNYVYDKADGGAGNDLIRDVSNVDGGAGDDTIHGTSLADRLLGGAGTDTIFAQDGDDEVAGGYCESFGNDRYVDGEVDVLNGENGTDKFVEEETAGDIQDFSGEDSLVLGKRFCPLHAK